MGVDLSPLVQQHALKLEQLKNKPIAIDCYNTLYQFMRTMPMLTDKHGRVTSHLVGLFNRTTRLMSMGLKLCYVLDGPFPEIKKHKRIVSGAAVQPRTSRTFTAEMIAEVRALLEALGIPVVQAPSEGEAQAAHMAARRDVWAVATQDYDALVFGAPRMIKNLTFAKTRRWPKGGKFSLIGTYLIELKELLKQHKLDKSQLLTLAVLIGSDFGPGVAGIGPKKGLKLVQKYGHRFDALFRTVGWNYAYSWKEVYDCMATMPVTNKYRLRWKKINRTELLRILVKEHDFNEARVLTALKRAEQKKS